LKDQIRELQLGEYSLDEFWDAVETLPDDIDGRDYKKIIKAIYKADGEPDFEDLEKLRVKIARKTEHETLQIWVDAQRIIRRNLRAKMRTMRKRKEINERKRQIKSGEWVSNLRNKRNK